MLHLIKGGCNGIGAWVLNSVLNGAILLMFLNFYVKTKRKRKVKVNGDCCNANENGNANTIEEEELDTVKEKTI